MDKKYILFEGYLSDDNCPSWAQLYKAMLKRAITDVIVWEVREIKGKFKQVQNVTYSDYVSAVGWLMDTKSDRFASMSSISTHLLKQSADDACQFIDDYIDQKVTFYTRDLKQMSLFR